MVAGTLILGLVAGWLLRGASPQVGEHAPEGQTVGSRTIHVLDVRHAGRVFPVSAECRRVLPEWVS